MWHTLRDIVVSHMQEFCSVKHSYISINKNIDSNGIKYFNFKTKPYRKILMQYLLSFRSISEKITKQHQVIDCYDRQDGCKYEVMFPHVMFWSGTNNYTVMFHNEMFWSDTNNTTQTHLNRCLYIRHIVHCTKLQSSPLSLLYYTVLILLQIMSLHCPVPYITTLSCTSLYDATQCDAPSLLHSTQFPPTSHYGVIQ